MMQASAVGTPERLMPSYGLLVACLIGHRHRADRALSLAIGYVSLDLAQAIGDVLSGNSTLAALVLIELRLPRALLGCFVGFSLGISGAALQGLMRNPLAEPGIIGVSGAAAFGAVCVFYFGLAGTFSLALPLGGIAGAAAATFLLYGLSGRGAGTMTLILAGVAINSFAGALTSLALNLSPNPYAVTEIVFWLLGSLADRSLPYVWLVLPLMVLGWALLIGSGPALDGLTLGEDTAKSLGFDLDRLRLQLIAGTALAVGSAVAVTGRDRLRGARGPASAAAAGGAPAGTAAVRQRARRRGADAGGRHRRPVVADPAGAQARGGDRDHRRAVPVQPDLSPARGAGVMEIEAQDIAIRFGPTTVLEGVNLVMRPGEMVGLVGPNGSGKTTLLKVLANLRAPEGGSVRYAGQPAGEVGARELARRIAYLAQGGTVHWPMRVEALVALGRLPHRRAFQGLDAADRSAIERAMLAADVVSLRARTMGQVSGGERMRILLARALAVDAELLLADEPIAALDPLHQLQVMDLLRSTAGQGRGVIVVLHDLALAARFCDRLILLAQGRILVEGPPAAGAHRRPHRARLWGRGGARRARRNTIPVAVEAVRDIGGGPAMSDCRFSCSPDRRSRSELERGHLRGDRRVRPRPG